MVPNQTIHLGNVEDRMAAQSMNILGADNHSSFL
jgi:hypothetical protein